MQSGDWSWVAAHHGVLGERTSDRFSDRRGCCAGGTRGSVELRLGSSPLCMLCACNTSTNTGNRTGAVTRVLTGPAQAGSE